MRFFSFNLKLICTCEFFKKLKLHSPKRLVQLQLFEKLTVQINPKLNSKSYDYLYKLQIYTSNNKVGVLLLLMMMMMMMRPFKS